jgi:hypothetical protein
MKHPLGLTIYIKDEDAADRNRYLSDVGFPYSIIFANYAKIEKYVYSIVIYYEHLKGKNVGMYYLMLFIWKR